MTTTAKNIVHCEQCENTFQGCGSEDFYKDFAAVLLSEAQDKGWQISGKVICPDCIKANHDFWRLPTEKELTSMLWSTPITNPTAFDDDICPYEDNEFFMNPEQQNHFLSVFPEEKTIWSSTKSSMSGVYGLRTDLGKTVSLSEGATLKVRLVRTHQAAKSWSFGEGIHKRYTISSCGTYVTDNRTGLQWKRYLEPEKYTWDEAVSAFGKER